ncbi:hypothetical protein UB51_09890 [Paenibacillus sp. IHBB 10380]|nr:hypothetical protein UB51_09890 [Paenibacillus sp. IHBB 10380]
MNKKVGCTLIVSLLMLIGVGCGQNPLSDAGTPTVLSSNNQDVSATVGKEEDKEQSQKIQVYFTDPQAMELEKTEQDIQFANNTEKYQEAFKALQKDSNPELISLWSKMELKTISFSEGMITLDIHMPDEARLGAGGEQFALEALKNTLFQFDEVKSIELLVDGEVVESLMGHAELEHPILRD